MSHAKTALRNAFYSSLIGLTTTEDRVFKSRVHSLQDTDLPGLCVYTGDEYIDEEEGKVEGIQHRSLEIKITCTDKLVAGLDDNLDVMEAEVEAAIFATNVPGCFALDLLGTEQEITDGVETPVGKSTMTWRVQYLTEEGRPGNAIS